MNFILSVLVQLVQRAAWMPSTGTQKTQPSWNSEFLKAIINNSLSFKSCSYLQGTTLPPADPTCQKYSCIFIFIIFVFHGCHGSKIYTQQPHCHFQLQIELLCSQFGSAEKEICLYSRPSPVLGRRPGCRVEQERGFYSFCNK